MSSIATMYSFSRQFGLKYYVTRDQYDLLTYYFQPSTLDLAVVDVALANISTLGVDLFKIFQHSQCRVMLLLLHTRHFSPPLGEALAAAGGEGHAV